MATHDDDVMTFESSNDVTNFRSHDDATFRSKVEEIVLNADAGLGDVYLVSQDRRYFLAHRIVLVSSSTIFSTLLTVNCDFCSDVIDDKVVLVFAEISGDILKSFLSLIYTGFSENMNTSRERGELQYLCRQLQLKSVNPAPAISARPSMGYKIVETPECYTTLNNFMHSPAQVNNIDKFLDISMNEFGTMLKTEPADYIENDLDYYEDSVVVDLPLKKSGRRTRVKKRLKRDDNSEEDDEQFDPDYKKPKLRRSHCRLPEVDIPYREENGQLYCLSVNCEATFNWMNGLKEHYFDKHATEEERKFPCDFCGTMFGTNGQRNKHQKKCCPDNENSNSSTSPRKRRSKKLQKSTSVDIQAVVKKELEDADLDVPMAEKDGNFFCLSGTCEADERSFPSLVALKEHFYEEHATDEQKPFTCHLCTGRFGTFGLKNKHMNNEHPEHVAQNSCAECSEDFESSFALRKHIKEEHDGDDSDVKSRFRAPVVNIPMKEENGLVYCLSGNCAEESRSFQYKTGVNSLKEHFFEEHATNDQKHFPCKKCGQLFGTRRLQIKHYRSNHSIVKGVPLPLTKTYSCKVCSEKFEFLRLLRKHHMEAHKDVEMGEELSRPRVVIAGPKVDIPMREEDGRFHCLSGDCEIKKTSFQYVGGLREHYFDKHAREDEKFFPCNRCGEIFGTNGLRNRHHKYVHPDEPLQFDVAFPFAKPVHECTICKQDLGSRAKLEEHVRLHHSDQERPFICHECGKTFKHNNNLRDHMQLHSNTLITCEVCGQTFKSETFFKRHYTIKHATDYGCTLCDKRFGMKSQLTGHMRYHTGEKPFVCEACGKGYEMRSALTVHIKRCQNKEERVRKFACDMCDKLFFEPDKVRKHKRFVHLKLRNYRCDECGDTFRDLKMLQNHVDKHAGISFPCPHCSEKFACRNYLKKHLRKRHRELRDLLAAQK